MDREKIRNMDFQEFKKVLPSMEGVHYLKADGQRYTESTNMMCAM